MILIDADSIVYAAGFACEQKMYHVDSRVFNDKDTAIGYAEFMGLEADEVTEFIQVQPVSHALANARNTLHGILSDLQQRGYDVDDVQVYLTEGLSFRKDVATLRPYKGQRLNVKPVHYEAIREYLVKHWLAYISSEFEADDCVAMDSKAYPRAVICSIDKDLNQLPGTHWNWRTKELYEVTEAEGLRNFYRQMLTGDAVDNIPGLYKLYGKKCTKKILDPLEGIETLGGLWQYVKNVYHQAAMEFESRGEYLPYNVPQVLLEIGTLLYLKRSPTDEWSPPE